MRKRLTILLLTAIIGANAFHTWGQTANEVYIDNYKDLAIRQMGIYGIPASIILAQGILESGAGQSSLARKANNHFGIKCTPEWRGKYMLKDDDLPNEKFRVYASSEESYTDHSLFLTTRSRYSFLFDYDITDYRSWAHGLKKAGYATNPNYAYSLINLIERYRLYDYDVASGGSKRQHHASKNLQANTGFTALSMSHQVRMNNDNYYVIAREGDSYAMISKELGVSVRKLAKYNETSKDYVLQRGDIVYLEKKKKVASVEYEDVVYAVQPGESLYSISQKFGIRLKSLYSLNGLPSGYSAVVGDELFLR